MGMSLDADGMQVIEAEVPLGEMSSYAIDLRSMTQGRGSFTIALSVMRRHCRSGEIIEAKALNEAE